MEDNERRLFVILNVSLEVTRTGVWYRYYDLRRKKWLSTTGLITPHLPFSYADGLVFNDMFYYSDRIGEQVLLYKYDFTTKQRTTWNLPDHVTDIKYMHGHDGFLYFHVDCREEAQEIVRYDTLTNTFQTFATLVNPRSGAALIFYRGNLHILGGEGRNPGYLNSVEKYDPDTNSWIDCPPMLMARRGPPGVAILNGMLYVCGGIGTNTVEVYNPDTETWYRVAGMDKFRYSVIAIADEARGRLIAFGGEIQDNKIEVYDPLENRWVIDWSISSGLTQLPIYRGGLVSPSCITDA